MEGHPDLHLRGTVMAQGNYTFEEVRKWSTEELLFIDHYQKIKEQFFWQKLGSYLGVSWDLEQIKGDSNNNEMSKEVFLPLTIALNPQFYSKLQELAKSRGVSNAAPYVAGGEYRPQAGEQIVSIDKLDKETFLNMIPGVKPKAKKK